MKTFKNLYTLAGQKPKCFVMLAGPNIHINIFSELIFFLNFEQIPAHTLVKSDVDTCTFQLKIFTHI
jgi:hypothetical protein